MKNAIKTTDLAILTLAMVLFGIPLITVSLVFLAHFWKFVTVSLLSLLTF